MTAIQEDKLSMEIVVVDFLKNTAPAILAKMPEFDLLNTEFSKNVDKLRAFQSGQTLNRTGNRMSKEQLREQMTLLGFVTAARVCAYAIANDDEVLQMEVTYTKSELILQRDSVIANTCQNIHDIALAKLANLANFGVTDVSLQELNESIIQYNVMLPKTRAGIVTQTSFTDNIVQVFEENDKLLFRMDKLVTMLIVEEVAFHDDYFKSRKIVNTGHRKLALKGNITDELGQPIESVIITIETPTPQTATSSELGNYQFKAIEGGVFPVTYKRDGYITERVFLVFTPNARVDFNVVLKQAEEQERSA